MNKFLLAAFAVATAATSQAELFDWENATLGLQGSISQTVGSLTATASAPPNNLLVLDFGSQTGFSSFGTRSFVGEFRSPARDPIRVDFSVNVGSVTAWFGDNNPDDDGIVILNAYDSGNNLVDTNSMVLGTMPDPFSLTVSGNIAYVTGSTTGTEFPNSVAWDNFAADIVPEPATLAALGLGAAAIVRRRRRTAK